MPAGHYALGARLAGYQDTSKSVELGGAATVPVLLTLASEKPLTINVLAAVWTSAQRLVAANGHQ